MAKQNIKLSKQTKQILLVVGAVLVIVYFIRKYRANMEQSEIDKSTTVEGKPVSSTGVSKPSWEQKYNALPSVGTATTLKKGSKSKEVWQLQYLFNTNVAGKEGQAKLVVDGIFGSKTESAVKYVVNGLGYANLDYFTKLSKMSRLERLAFFNKPTIPNEMYDGNTFNWLEAGPQY